MEKTGALGSATHGKHSILVIAVWLMLLKVESDGRVQDLVQQWQQQQG